MWGVNPKGRSREPLQILGQMRTKRMQDTLSQGTGEMERGLGS